MLWAVPMLAVVGCKLDSCMGLLLLLAYLYERYWELSETSETSEISEFSEGLFAGWRFTRGLDDR